MRTPEFLTDIYVRLHRNKHGSGISTRFRVRDVETLWDYCVYCVFEFGSNGQPTWFKALQLDFFCQDVRLNGNLAKFALLSSDEEIERLSSLHYSNFSTLLSNAYRKLNANQCEIGEG